MSNRSTLLLEHHLKELTAAHLPQGVPQAGRPVRRRGHVDHPDYLLRLAELELIDRHQRMVERRIRAAHVSPRSKAWTPSTSWPSPR